eukprot:8556680-Ditylum_brightwellii.AAC.1
MAELEVNQPVAQLDLLSELGNSPIPVLDFTEVSNTSFGTKEHIGFECIRKYKREVPTKTKCLEVDEDTRKGPLKYMYRGLELIEANVIQESLILQVHPDDGKVLWTFSTVLNHRLVENRCIKEEVWWDNRETLWKPLEVLWNDNPVTVT